MITDIDFSNRSAILKMENEYKVLIDEDLYRRNFTLIDIRDFGFLINNNICNVSRVGIVTIVHTALENKDARDIIR